MGYSKVINVAIISRRGYEMKQVFAGLLIIIAGVLLLLSNFEVGGVKEIVQSWWPLIIVIFGLFGFWNSERQFFWPALTTIVGLLILLNTLDIAELDYGKLFWPAVFVVIGTSLVFGSFQRKNHRQVQTHKDNSHTTSVFLSSASSRNVSDNYLGGTVSVVMGGAEIDLSSSKIKKSATLDVNVLMGGIDLRVPADVIVKNQTQLIMAGFEDKSLPKSTKSQPVLYIRGMVIMGGIEVQR